MSWAGYVQLWVVNLLECSFGGLNGILSGSVVPKGVSSVI